MLVVVGRQAAASRNSTPTLDPMKFGDELSQPRRAWLRPHHVILALLSAVVTWKYLQSPHKSAERAPINAQQVLDACADLHAKPHIPLGFAKSRSESDRWVPGTTATLLKNGTIWTGNNDGKQILHGDILISRGLIKLVGDSVNAHQLAKYGVSARELDIVELHGAWVTPGCVPNGFGVSCQLTTQQNRRSAQSCWR